MIFLSTLSLRRATVILRVMRRPYANFYPRSPCGERPGLANKLKTPCVISIHALLAESDNNTRNKVNKQLEFLSTLSLRRATSTSFTTSRIHQISIHALLAESDDQCKQCYSPSPNFYPRSPCGERLSAGRESDTEERFLSTLSLRRATR